MSLPDLALDGCDLFVADPDFRPQLRDELGPAAGRWLSDDLLLAPRPPRDPAWARNIWRAPRTIEIASIGAAVKALKAIQRNWCLHPPGSGLNRRARLIADQLPPVKAAPLALGAPAPHAPLGSWTLLDPHLLLAAGDCASPFPNGIAHFIEDRAGPPNRAYLKLWEALARMRRAPGPGDRCLDLGASPGGWSWSLAMLGAEVIAVDKAPLDPAVTALPTVTVRQDSAFALDPAALGPIDWLVCDVICYPARTLKLVEQWLAAGTVRHMVVTLKFQGATDHATARAFQAIPGGRLVHLSQNKHELTWLWCAESALAALGGGVRDQTIPDPTRPDSPPTPGPTPGEPQENPGA